MATVLFAVTLPSLYFTPLYEWSLRYGVVHAWLHIHFVVVGRAVRRGDRRPRPQPAPLEPSGPPRARAGTVPLHAFLGVALLSSTTVIAAAGTPAPGGTWGAVALSDQRTGAGILWAAGELFGLVLGAVVLARWMAHSEREARRHDRLLDAGLAS